jgi:hypothetical protein
MIEKEIRMKKTLAVLFITGSLSVACASESKIKIEASSTEQSAREVSGVQEVERPASLQYDSPEYKKHKEYLKFMDRHYDK